MKPTFNHVIYSSFCLILCIPAYSSQLTVNLPTLVHSPTTNSGTAVDLNANVNVSGTIEAPLTVNIPTETLNRLKVLAAETICFGYGVNLITEGTKTLINDSADSSESRLEKGLKNRKSVASTIQSISDPLIVDKEEDDQSHRKSLCSRFKCSRGGRQIGAGFWFIGCGLSFELLFRISSR